METAGRECYAAVRMPRRVFATVTFLLLCSCGELGELPTDPIDDEPIDPSATFSRVQTEIFTPTCAQLGCHDTIGQQSQMVLVAGRSYAELVNRPSVEVPAFDRVEPGRPGDSYLYMKVNGDPRITGDRMPQGLPQLSDAQIRLIRDWIRRGAPND
jgi:hypothetical protein